ncbi:hypothetical protein BDB00DRAFT_837681 [Zychaea mexicana]|uniref:uncharacterized protein n=1 Tax=Zychaea mexicana TaxID=64656 RepID=UPI0022FE8057|nr:uncharacterized protein BDB00DRAFT_837681 [Zychaea mexicana]KAI9490395.1 hypothetical protein BDB00DRAFT_837681 [Zychaea mexicana]
MSFREDIGAAFAQGLVLPSIMVCSLIMTGALVYMSLEDWTYSEALIFCWTAVTTIGYGDITPSRPEGRVFFLFYTVLGISIVGYMLLSIRAVITGTSSDIMKVNLMRVESLHDYSRHQREKWLNRHPDHTAPVSRRYSTAPLGGEGGGADTPTAALNDNGYDVLRSNHDDDDNGDQVTQPLLRRRTTAGSARPRSLSNMSTFSNYTMTGILNNKDRQILVQVITKSGVVRMGVILIICWFGGAGIFCLLEQDWTYLDGLYFAFATQLTIGFGDIVPQTALAQEFWLVYIIISIAVAAYFISLCGDVLIEKLQIVDDNEDPDTLFYTDEVTGSPEDLDGMSNYASFGRALAAEDEDNARTVPTGTQQQKRLLPPASDKGSTYGRGEIKYHQGANDSIATTGDSSVKMTMPIPSSPLQQMQLARHSSLPIVSTATRDTASSIKTPRRSVSKKPYPLKIFQQPRYDYMYSAAPSPLHNQPLSSSMPTSRAIGDSMMDQKPKGNNNGDNFIANKGVRNKRGGERYGSLNMSCSENTLSSDRGNTYYDKDDINRPRHPCSPLASPSPSSDERQHKQTMLSGHIGATVVRKRESHEASTATASPPRIATERLEPRQSSVSGETSYQAPAFLSSTSNSQHETVQQQRHNKKKISKYLPIAVTTGSSSRSSKKRRQT